MISPHPIGFMVITSKETIIITKFHSRLIAFWQADNGFTAKQNYRKSIFEQISYKYPTIEIVE